MSDFKTIDSERVSGKRVLVRVDLNVPMKNGKVTDATRIERAAPTLKELAEKGAKVAENTVVCIIEAMKIMNEIQAELKGTIVEVLVESGQPVEYGQRLFKVKQS